MATGSVPGVLSASGSSAEAVVLRRFRAARRAGEPDLFMAILDVDGPNAHWRVAAVTPWKQHTRICISPLCSCERQVARRTQCAAKLGQEAQRRAVCRLATKDLQDYGGEPPIEPALALARAAQPETEYARGKCRLEGCL